MLRGAASRDIASQIAWVEIEEHDADGAFYLFYFDSNGNCLTETWHETVERAKVQAQFEFETEQGDWKDVDADA